jgi:branched-chain amino acid transport system ATP-binding protein
MLELTNVEVVYGGAILALSGVSMTIPEGGIVALLGANGAGKSTTLKAISGLLRTEHGRIAKGGISLDGKPIDHLRPDQVVKAGIVHVVEGRQVLQHMTVDQNLTVASHLRKDRDAVRADRELVYEYFPRLQERSAKTAGYLSGGEQQMLVIGRAIMARPRIILLDEPSMGLAPMVVEHIFDILGQINEQQKITLLIVEQNVPLTLSIAQYGYIMVNGRIELHGKTEDLRNNDDIKEFYLGFDRRRNERAV